MMTSDREDRIRGRCREQNGLGTGGDIIGIVIFKDISRRIIQDDVARHRRSRATGNCFASHD